MRRLEQASSNNNILNNENYLYNNIQANTSLKNNLQSFIDIDAIFSQFKIKKISQYLKSSIIFDCKQANLFCKSKNIAGSYNLLYENSQVSIKKFPSIKLGHTLTSIGRIEVYIISRTLNIIEDETFKTDVLNKVIQILIDISDKLLAKQMIFINEKNQEIIGTLNIEDIQLMVDKLNTTFYDLNLYFYLESFGNKKHTVSSLNKFDMLESKITSFLNPAAFDNITLDICVEFSSGKNKVTIATNKLFESFDIEPNFKPLLYDKVLNYNNTFKEPKKLKLISSNSTIDIYKINFYSTFKNSFNTSIFKSFNSFGSLQVFLNNGFKRIADAVTNKKTNIKLETEYDVTQYFNDCASKDFPYRLELRCKIKDVKNIIQFINDKKLDELFLDIEADKFFYILQKTLDINKSNILTGCELDLNKHYSFNTFFRSILIEKIMNEIYIKGKLIVGNLKLEYNYEISNLIENKKSTMSVFDFSDTTGKLFLLISKSSKIKLIQDTLKYSYKMKSIQKTCIMHMIDVFFNKKRYTLFEEILTCIAIEETNNESNNYKMFLKNALITDPSIDFYEFIKKCFIKPKKVYSKILFLNMISSINNISNEISIENFKQFCIDKKIKTITIKCKKRYVTYKLTFDTFSVETNCLKAILKNSITIDESLKVLPNISELIRYMNAMFKYKDSNSRFIDIKNDFVYGFFLVRNTDWLKIDFNSYPKSLQIKTFLLKL